MPDVYIAKGILLGRTKGYREPDILQDFPQEDFFTIEKFCQGISVSENNNDKFPAKILYLIQP